MDNVAVHYIFPDIWRHYAKSWRLTNISGCHFSDTNYTYITKVLNNYSPRWCGESQAAHDIWLFYSFMNICVLLLKWKNMLSCCNADSFWGEASRPRRESMTGWNHLTRAVKHLWLLPLYGCFCLLPVPPNVFIGHHLVNASCVGCRIIENAFETQRTLCGPIVTLQLKGKSTKKCSLL